MAFWEESRWLIKVQETSDEERFSDRHGRCDLQRKRADSRSGRFHRRSHPLAVAIEKQSRVGISPKLWKFNVEGIKKTEIKKEMLSGAEGVEPSNSRSKIW